MSFKFFDLDSWHEFRSLLKIFSWVNFLILFSQCFRWAFSGGVTNTKAGLCYNFFVYPQDFTSLRDFMETSHAFPVTGLTLRFESFWNYNDIIVFPGFFCVSTQNWTKSSSIFFAPSANGFYIPQTLWLDIQCPVHFCSNILFKNNYFNTCILFGPKTDANLGNLKVPADIFSLHKWQRL